MIFLFFVCMCVPWQGRNTTVGVGSFFLPAEVKEQGIRFDCMYFPLLYHHTSPQTIFVSRGNTIPIHPPHQIKISHWIPIYKAQLNSYFIWISEWPLCHYVKFPLGGEIHVQGSANLGLKCYSKRQGPSMQMVGLPSMFQCQLEETLHSSMGTKTCKGRIVSWWGYLGFCPSFGFNQLEKLENFKEPKP